jgi:hypothetical protein
MSEDKNNRADDPDFMRAEAMVDQLTERMRDLASRLGRQARWTAARAREEVEDMWAEAQRLSGDGHK